MAAAAQAPPVREPVTCARPGCPVRFIPRTRVHVYCSALCKKRVHAYRFALRGR